jgi:hypothetical protein
LKTQGNESYRAIRSTHDAEEVGKPPQISGPRIAGKCVRVAGATFLLCAQNFARSTKNLTKISASART